MRLSNGGNSNDHVVKKSKTDRRHAKGRTYKGGGDNGFLDRIGKKIKKTTKKVVKGAKKVYKKVDDALDRPSKWDKALVGHKKSEKKSKSKSKHKSTSKTKPNIMSETRAKNILAGKDPNTPVKGSSKKSSKKTSSSSKHKSTSSHKTTSSKGKTSSHKTTSSGKKDAVKRATGKSTASKGKTSSKPKTTKTTKPKASSKKTPSKESQIKKGYKNASDSYYNNQKSLLDAGKTGDLNDINNAYLQNMEVENKNIRDNNNAYDDRVGEINQNAYQQAQMTKLGAQEMGIQNSQQMLGLQAGDNYRTNNAREGAMTERDRMLADINGRISTITQTKLNDVNKVNSQYNINLRGARAEADRMYYDKSSGFDTDKYTQDRQHQWDVEDREAGYQHDIDMFNRQQKANQQAMARQSAYTRASTGGRRSGSSSGSSSSGSSSGLKQQANQYKQAKATTALDSYNKSFQNKNQSVVVKNKYPLGAPPTVNQNQNLSAWQKYKMLGV